MIDTVVDNDAIGRLPAKIAELCSRAEHHVYVIVTSTVAAQQCVLMKKNGHKTFVFSLLGPVQGLSCRTLDWLWLFH
ncbi:hypothetical protein C427_0333 [Paraglaciecola psychrophila 170]|uniref:Uncharacterized protein n=1 Tax=Paraglaciecola psychrophila 170 TaxID=1129794 RepID=M4RIN9_9ALTE|nr:hypothetical protein C427_0333 [Paraglaciecola psychrophila 170]